MKPTNRRLESLDILRGFDLFCLVAAGNVLHSLGPAIDAPWYDNLLWGFSHVEWEGFSPWDLVMPLFMFMAGVSIPFALSRYKTSANSSNVYRRIAKRVVLLWIFGMMCQGNLLELNPDKIYLYTNTLQAIAAGYFIAALLFLHTHIKVQIGMAATLLLIYWGAMQFIGIDGYGKGDFTPNGNLAEWIDRWLLGQFRDLATIENGTIVFNESYRYTWILSSLNFGVTTLTGLFAGYILRSEIGKEKKGLLLIGIGIAMAATGWLWGLQHPVIKKLWTSSMVLVSSGYCFLLMGLFYYWIDYKGHHKGFAWLKVYGMNSIAAYMLTNIINFSCIGNSLFYGLEPYMGNWYAALITTSNVLIIYSMLWILYKHNIFLKV